MTYKVPCLSLRQLRMSNIQPRHFKLIYDDKDRCFESTIVANCGLTTSREVTLYFISASFQFAGKKLQYNHWQRGRAATHSLKNILTVHWSIFPGTDFLSLVHNERAVPPSLNLSISQSWHVMLSPMTTPLTSRRNQFPI